MLALVCCQQDNSLLISESAVVTVYGFYLNVHAHTGLGSNGKDLLAEFADERPPALTLELLQYHLFVALMALQ